MNIILLSGGSGTRLWPLSSEQRPKQFIPLFPNGDGAPVSMLQNVWGQLKNRGLHRSALIATSISQRDLILEQLGREIDLVPEPEKRDTFPAILLSVAYLHSRRGISRDEVVAVMPVDSCVEYSFYDALQQLPHALSETGANVALMGVKPSYPSVKYGYMIPKQAAADTTTVTIREFHEKPSSEEAARYIEQGALWNCGVFCFRAGFLLDKLKAMGLPYTYEELLLAYSDLENRSFDYAVLEPEQHIAAMMYDGPWKDLGNWCTLVEELNGPVTGNGLISKECSNVHIVNELDIPAVVHGLSEVVVAASKEGILVTRKGAGAGLKEVLNQLHLDGRSGETSLPEQSSRIVDRSVFGDGTVVTTTRIHLDAGSGLIYRPLIDGSRRSVSWTVLHGRLQLVQNGGKRSLTTGENAVLEHGEEAELLAGEGADLLEIVTVRT